LNLRDAQLTSAQQIIFAINSNRDGRNVRRFMRTVKVRWSALRARKKHPLK